MKLALSLAALCCWIPLTLVAGSPKTQVRLILSAQSAKPGDTVWAGLEMRMPNSWHTYWRNPGDAGQATEIHWTLPAGISAGPIHWPIPEKLLTPPLTTFVYSSNVVLLVPLQIAQQIGPGLKELKAAVSWLECGQLCVPAKGAVRSTLQIGPESKASPDLALLETWRSRVPQKLSGLAVRAQWEKPPVADSRPLLIRCERKSSATSLDFYPYGDDAYELAGPSELLASGPAQFTLRKMVKKFSGDWPVRISGILVESGTAPVPQAAEVDLAISPSSNSERISTLPR